MKKHWHRGSLITIGAALGAVSRQLALQKHWHECMENAVSDAVSSVNHLMLTVLANQHGMHATSTVLAAKTR